MTKFSKFDKINIGLV